MLAAVVVGTGWMARRSLQQIWSPSRPTAAVGAPARGGTLVASVRAEPRSFNRLVSRDLTTEVVTLLTQSKLVRVNRTTQEVEPWLAERWDALPDGRQFTLHLRRGIQWSDGQPFTAADVLFTLEAIADPATGSVLASALSVDGKPITATAPDDATVVVTYPAPFGPGIRLLDNLVVLPKHRLEAVRRAGTLASAWGVATPPSELAGLGPFVLERYEAGQRAVFARNPRYWRTDAAGTALPYLDRVVLELIPDQNAELLRLQAGEIDMTQQHLRSEDYAVVRQQEQQGRLRLIEAGVSLDPDSFFLNLNPDAWKTDARRAWITQKAFRQAISHAVDREAFANTVFLGAAVPVHGPITPGNTLWFWPDLPRLSFDRTRATALLQSIGLTNRDSDPWLEDAGGAEARFSVLAFSTNTAVQRGAQFVRESLAAVGIDMQIVLLEPGALIERMLAGRFEGIYFNYSVTDTDPAMQRDFWSSTGSAHIWHLGQKAASTKWEEEIDLLMARQAASTDEAERVRLFRLAQRIFADEVPVLYFAAPRLYLGVSSRVRNVTPAVLRPQLLWSADTLAVDPAAPGPATPAPSATR